MRGLVLPSAQDGETPLMEASHYGNLEVVRILLAAGAKKEAKNWVGVWAGGGGSAGIGELVGSCVHHCDSG